MDRLRSFVKIVQNLLICCQFLCLYYDIHYNIKWEMRKRRINGEISYIVKILAIFSTLNSSLCIFLY